MAMARLARLPRLPVWRLSAAMALVSEVAPLDPWVGLGKALSSTSCRFFASGALDEDGRRLPDLIASIPADRIRNFSIVAHIDHGKSTLADRILERTGALAYPLDKQSSQVLDKLSVERERGITVKAQTATIVHEYGGHAYLLNLVDTPGHVDFSYEVSRSLSACEGCVLLVDATQGIQAQTVSNCLLALEEDLEIVPAVNKIDAPAAEPEECARQIEDVLGLGAEALWVSAKTGEGVAALLNAVVERVPPPRTERDTKPFKALIFDAHHDQFRGVVCLCRVVDGSIKAGDRVASCGTGTELEVLEVGLMCPEPTECERLEGGQIGYVVTGMKNSADFRIGDTLRKSVDVGVEALPGFKPIKSMCFGGIFPAATDEYESLKRAIEKLTLNDSSVVVHRESSQAMGPGFRCGFLGLLHMEVFLQRLEEEHRQSVVSTKPFVPLLVVEADGSREREILSPGDWDEVKWGRATRVLEPVVLATIVCPNTVVGKVITLCHDHRGTQVDHTALGSQRVMLRYRLPLTELAGDFYDSLKGCSSGYATLEYEEAGHEEADLVKLDVRVNGEVVDSLARVVHRDHAFPVGKAMVSRLKKLLDRQAFELALQAVVGSKVVARETLAALRKDVLAKCYGGDVSRKKKLLKKQKEGKKRLKSLGSVNVPVEVFPQLLK